MASRFGVVLQIVHFARIAVIEPVEVTCKVVGLGGSRDAGEFEAQYASLRFQSNLDRLAHRTSNRSGA